MHKTIMKHSIHYYSRMATLGTASELVATTGLLKQMEMRVVASEEGTGDVCANSGPDSHGPL